MSDLPSAGMLLLHLGTAGASHGFGDERDTTGAEMGVGRVEVVICDKADFGVVSVVDAEKGVKGVKGVLTVDGESSVRTERDVGSAGVLPDRSRLRDWSLMLISRGTIDVLFGITSGVKDFGERGCRLSMTGGSWSSSICRLASNSAHSSNVSPLDRGVLSPV